MPHAHKSFAWVVKRKDHVRCFYCLEKLTYFKHTESFMHWYKRVALDSPDGDYSCQNGWIARGHFGIENKALGFKMERHIDVVVRGTRIYLKKLYPDTYSLDYYDR